MHSCSGLYVFLKWLLWEATDYLSLASLLTLRNKAKKKALFQSDETILK